MYNEQLLPPPPPSNGIDWSWIRDTHSRDMIESGYRAIEDSRGWNILRNFQGESIIFSRNNDIINLCNTVNEYFNDGHSGSSMGFTMRALEYIAKNGIEQYKIGYIRSIQNDNNRYEILNENITKAFEP
jgi:hypothetical protein